MKIIEFENSSKWFAPALPYANLTAPWQVPNLNSHFMYPDESGTIEYKLNSFGYRNCEFNDELLTNSIWCVGHSDVFGIGVDETVTWARQLAQLSNLTTVNLGINGASWDTIARLLSCALQKYTPSAIVIQSTTDERREFVNSEKQTIVLPNMPEHAKPYPKFYKYIDDESNQYNREKNLMLINTVCKNVNHYIFDLPNRWDLIKQYPAADKQHIGQEVHTQIANQLFSKYFNNGAIPCI